jgi:hypothetical protein
VKKQEDIAKTLLNSLADKLGVPVKHVWDVLTRQAKYQSLQNVLRAIMFMTAVGGLIAFDIIAVGHAFDTKSEYRVTVSYYLTGPEYHNIQEDHSLQTGLWIVAALCASLALYSCVDEIIKLLVAAVSRKENPEYFALEEIRLFFDP